MAYCSHTGDLTLTKDWNNSLKEFDLLGIVMEDEWRVLRECLKSGIPNELPPHPGFDSSVDHAPNRRKILQDDEKILALKNALRYFDKKFHHELVKEFLEELDTFGRITMQRYRPTEYEMKAYPIEAYPANSKQSASIMLLSLIHI